jgi:WD40 repeat protein
MSDMSIDKEIAFDPYHKWLGIPKAQRPPTLYQLLGLAQGEADAEVIEEAAIRQTTHLRAYQVGPHADDCTKLLNEISAARQVLVNPQKRQDYDSKLAQVAAKRAAAQEGGRKTALAAPVVESAFADLGGEEAAPASKPRRDASKPNKPASGKRPAAKVEPKALSQTFILAAAGGAGLLVVGIVAIVAVLMSSPTPPQVVKIPQPPVVGDPPNPPKGKLPNDVRPPNDNVKAPNDVKPPVNKDPLAGITGFPPLGAFTVASPPRNLTALADGRVLFGDSNLNVYDAGNSRALAPMNFPDAAGKGIRFAPAPDGKKVYVAIPDAARLSAFDFKQNQVASLKPSSDISALAISPNGSTLVTGTFKGQVRIWNLITLDGGSAMSASHGPRPVEMAVFSRDGELAATASEKSIMLWNVRDNKFVGALANGHQPTSMAFTPDGQSLLVTSSEGLQSTPINRNSWTTIKTRRPGILRVAFTSATNLAVLRADELELYEWPTMSLVRQSPINSGDADTLAATPDGKAVFVGLSSSRLMAFGTENDVVLKGHGPDGTDPPGPPVAGSYVGAWQYVSAPTGSTKVKIVVRKVGNIHSATLEIDRTGTLCRGHVDSFRSINGKLRGNVILDTAFPFPWSNLRELTLDPPSGNMMQSELRGDALNPYTLQRQGGDFAPPPPPTPPSPPPPPAPPAPKSDPPSEDKIKEVTATIRDTYKSDYAKKTAADRAEFAERLLKLASDSKDNPADRYVLCCEARDLGAAAGKWEIVSDAFEQLETHFKVDLLPQKEAALQTLIKSGLSTKESATEATEAAMQAVGEAIAADQLTLAGNFVAIASSASAKTPSVPLILLVKKADTELKLVTQEADAVKKARETLKSAPTDPAANLAVGRYDALRRGEWESAIALLAKGGDGELQSAARKELEAPKDGPGQLKVGDEWWALAEKEKDSAWVRAALQGRAGHWYRKAATQVTGLSGALITERLKTIDETPSPFHSSSSGATTELKSLRGHKAAVTNLTLMPDGKFLISASLDSTVKRWDLKLAKNLYTLPAGQPVYGLAFSPSSQLVALEFKDSVKAIEMANPASTVKRLPSGNGNALPGAFWVDEERLAFVGPSTYTSAGGFFAPQSFQHSMRISAIQASPTHQQVVTIGEETWLCQTFEDGRLSSQRQKTQLNDSTSAAFSPTRPVIAVATADKKISLYDSLSRFVTTTFEGAGSVTRSIAFSPNGDRLFTGGEDGVVTIWDVNTGKEVRHFSTGSKGVTSILVMPDGKQFITGGGDGVIRLWAMPREKATKTASAETTADMPALPASPGVGPPVTLPDSRIQRKLPPIEGGRRKADVSVLYRTSKRVTVDVRTVERTLDVDLYVFDSFNRQVAADATVGPDSHVAFEAQAGQTYRFEVVNLSSGIANSVLIYTSP